MMSSAKFKELGRRLLRNQLWMWMWDPFSKLNFCTPIRITLLVTWKFMLLLEFPLLNHSISGCLNSNANNGPFLILFLAQIGPFYVAFLSTHLISMKEWFCVSTPNDCYQKLLKMIWIRCTGAKDNIIVCFLLIGYIFIYREIIKISYDCVQLINTVTWYLFLIN